MSAIVKRHALSRRSLLEALAAALGCGALPARLPELAAAAHEAQSVRPPPRGAKLVLLDAAEAADVEAIAAQIIPTDETPGAREAGALYFIDRALATFLSQLAGDYRAQLAQFRAAFRRRRPDTPTFASLPSDQQREYLTTIDRTPFFETTRLLTLLAMFSPPRYGGNRDGIGWKLIGFEDRHFFQPPFGYYDRGYSQ